MDRCILSNAKGVPRRAPGMMITEVPEILLYRKLSPNWGFEHLSSQLSINPLKDTSI